jgi:hypothetical protein
MMYDEAAMATGRSNPLFGAGKTGAEAQSLGRTLHRGSCGSYVGWEKVLESGQMAKIPTALIEGQCV